MGVTYSSRKQGQCNKCSDIITSLPVPPYLLKERPNNIKVTVCKATRNVAAILIRPTLLLIHQLVRLLIHARVKRRRKKKRSV